MTKIFIKDLNILLPPPFPYGRLQDLIYIIKLFAQLYIGWTKLAELFWLNPWVPGGNMGKKMELFFKIFLFQKSNFLF